MDLFKIFRKFNDIDETYIYTDNHIHSNWTDGEGSVMKILKRSAEIGLNQIAITEHVRKESKFFDKYCEQVKNAKKCFRLNILEGFEAKIDSFNGELDVSNDILKKAKLRIGSVHRFPVGRRLYCPNQFKKNVCQEIELELSIAAIKNGHCDILGHPGGMSLRSYGEFPVHFFEEIISGCKKNKVIFEINAAYHKNILRKLKGMLKKYNPYISIGSDAHKIEEIGGWIKVLKREIIDE